MKYDFDQETIIINSFCTPQKRDRYLSLIKSKRSKFLGYLGSRLTFGFDERFLIQIESNNHRPDYINSFLVKNGAKNECYIISENPDLDGNCVLLAIALEQVVGSSTPTIVSCIPNRLLYYEGESLKERFFCVKG